MYVAERGEREGRVTRELDEDARQRVWLGADVFCAVPEGDGDDADVGLGRYVGRLEWVLHVLMLD